MEILPKKRRHNPTENATCSFPSSKNPKRSATVFSNKTNTESGEKRTEGASIGKKEGGGEQARIHVAKC